MWKIDARVFAFDEVDHGLEGEFARIVDREFFAVETLAEAGAEMELGCGAEIFAVEEVIAVRVEQAVAEDGRGEALRHTEKRLEAAGCPRIAAGLDDVGHAERGIEAARPTGELRAGGKEIAGQEIDGISAEVEALCGELGEGIGDARLGG